jgi:hypothetical protein
MLPLIPGEPFATIMIHSGDGFRSHGASVFLDNPLDNKDWSRA